MNLIRCACAGLWLLWSSGGWAVTRPAVIELYTSEGCSSCPPADQLLETLAHRSDVIALAFHVRYWDSLGWPDRFALAYADDRQARYGQLLHLASVFTPQMIVDAQRSFVGSDQRGILPALAAAREGVAIAFEPGAQQLRFKVAAAAGPAADVLLLALLPEAQTVIARGENGGRTLREVNVVRASIALGSWNGAEHSYTVSRAALPTDAAAVAVLLQQQGQHAILGAATFALN